MEGEKKDLEDKVESLESIVRMLELKAKNAADHGRLCMSVYVFVCMCVCVCACMRASECVYACMCVCL